MTAHQPSNPAARAADAAVRPKALRRPPDGRLALGLAGSVIMAGFACRELLHFQPLTRMHVSLSGEVEDFFFEPSDSSPLMVLLLCAWLLWRRRDRLTRLWGRGGSPGVTAACWLAAAGLFSWAIRAGAPDLQAVALIPTVLGAGNLLGGAAALRVMALPVAVLLFAVPLPGAVLNQVVWALQIGTAEFTGLLLQLIGVAAIVSGDRIILSDGLFAIIETCSGLRSIETLALLTILMIDLFDRRGWHAAALLVLSPFVAFLINGLRCLGLIFNPHADVASIHSLQGIAMLLGGVLLLYFADGLLARVGPARETRSRSERRAHRTRAPRAALGSRVAGVAAFAAILLALSWLPPFPAKVLAARAPVEVLDAHFDGWKTSNERNDWLFLGTTAFAGIAHRRYTLSGEPVDVFIGLADPGRRLRSYRSPKVAFPGSGWITESEQRARIAGRSVTLRVLRRGATRWLVAHWFEASPGLVAESLRGFLALDATPLVRTRIPAAIRLSTPLSGAGPSAVARGRERLEGFAERLAPGLRELSSPKGSP